MPWEGDTAVWVTSSGIPSLRLASWRGWRTRPWIQRLSGTISNPSLATSIAAEWISSLPASPASLGALQASSEAPMTSAGCGHKSSRSFARWDPQSSSWRTCQGSLLAEAWPPYSGDWPASVSMRNRICSARKRSAASTRGNVSSSLLPTPTAQSYGTNCGGSAGRTGKGGPSLEALARSLPTQTARDWRSGASNITENARPLSEVVHRLPTATATDAKASGAAGYSTQSGRHSGTTLTDAICGAAFEGRTGKLNPRFVEWMMGLPIGWTDCESSVTPSSTRSRRVRSSSSGRA